MLRARTFALSSCSKADMIIGRPNLIHHVDFRGSALWSAIHWFLNKTVTYRNKIFKTHQLGLDILKISTKVAALMSFHFPWRRSLSSFKIFKELSASSDTWVCPAWEISSWNPSFRFPCISIDIPSQKASILVIWGTPNQPTYPSCPSSALVTPRRQWYRDPSSRRECLASMF